MAIIWQSSWFWVMLSAVLLLMLGSVILHLRTHQLHIDTQSSTPNLSFTPVPANRLTLYDNPLHFPSLFDSINDDSPPNNIEISRPHCYNLPDGTYSCLGEIVNTNTMPIGDTSLEMVFYDDDGLKLGQAETTIEQRLIIGGESAPYRSVFRPLTDQAPNHNLSITGISQSFPPSPDIRALSILDTYGAIVAGRYNVTLTIENDSGYIAQDIRLFTTLENTEWGIVGYDVHEVEDALESGAQHFVQLEIVPHVIPLVIEPSFHAEGTIRH